MPTIARPHIILPEDRVALEDVLIETEVRYPDHPRLGAVLRAMRATDVRTRGLAIPRGTLDDPHLLPGERARRHFEAACDLAGQAARDALDEVGISPAEVDGLVCASTTGYIMPGLDVALINQLGLAPGVIRVPATQLGCSGGSWGLARAADLCARPEVGNVLVVAADLFPAYVHPSDLAMDAMISRALFGDAAGACVVRDTRSEPGPSIEETWDYTVPGTSDIVGYRFQDDGFHGHNSPRLFDAVGDAVQQLLPWLGKLPGIGETGVDFVVVHPGGPRIMDRLVEELGCDPALLGPSRQSLREVGNTGAVSILDVLARTYATPPPPGAHGLAIGMGPGITVTAAHLIWR
ncbi:type III polyketide synthase [Amycolatopsis vastitatis]|uniref:PhlD n=1 Tax=Amycolatopsis vastitatis TaxID=1905142 RepID=A0A229SLH1_9PSEU|nr:3-oxoacyl-[acyl-carrier-protein] synthase III C-terminal domain-containing protein [Amycolatopsis vastitatis]OXM59676.1 PhlD [Amycolatopsis vastitatis]